MIDLYQGGIQQPMTEEAAYAQRRLEAHVNGVLSNIASRAMERNSDIIAQAMVTGKFVRVFEENGEIKMELAGAYSQTHKVA